jgi:hypothetical protein
MKVTELSIAKDFSKTPGSRNRFEGDFSGQEFRERVLTPLVEAALASNGTLHVDLDNTAGYGTSFLEEAFGGLIRANVARGSELHRILRFKSDQEPYLVDEVWEYIDDAESIRSGISSP